MIEPIDTKREKTAGQAARQIRASAVRDVVACTGVGCIVCGVWLLFGYPVALIVFGSMLVAMSIHGARI